MSSALTTERKLAPTVHPCLFATFASSACLFSPLSRDVLTTSIACLTLERLHNLHSLFANPSHLTLRSTHEIRFCKLGSRQHFPSSTPCSTLRLVSNHPQGGSQLKHCETLPPPPCVDFFRAGGGNPVTPSATPRRDSFACRYDLYVVHGHRVSSVDGSLYNASRTLPKVHEIINGFCL